MSGDVTPRAALLLSCFLLANACRSPGPQNRPAEPPTSSVRSSETDDTSARESFARGNDHLEAGRWDRAVERYESALERAPDRWEIWLNLAVAYSKSGEFEPALDAVEHALARGGEGRPEVYYNLGNIYQRRGLYRRALRAYRTDLSNSDEPRAETLTNIGATLTTMGRPEQALEAYRRAQRRAPDDHRIRHGIAIALYLEGRYQASIDAFDRLLSTAPDFARGYYDKARPLVEAERLREAVEALRTYLEKAPDGRFRDRARSRIESLRERIGTSSPAP